MSARYLRKTDGDPYLYPWTETLAARKDFVEAPGMGQDEALGAAPEPDLEDTVLALTKVADLKAFADEHGLKLSGATKGVKAMQNEVIALMRAKLDAEAEADAPDDAFGEQ